MKLLIIFMLLLQQPTIKIIVSTSGGHESVRMEYEAFDDYRGFKNLTPGKYRFYLVSDDQCVLSILNSKNHDVTEAEIAKFNKLLENYRIEYFEQNKKIDDCPKFSSRRFPISISVR